VLDVASTNYVQGGKLVVLSATDLIKVLNAHPKMKALSAQGFKAFLQVET
jgi:hypothetical protein